MRSGKCEACGEPFPYRRYEPGLGLYRGRVPLKRYCSEICRKRAERARARQRAKGADHA